MPVPHTNRELQALDSIPLQIWRSRADGFTEYLNKRWLDYTGMTFDQALGWQWLATIHPDDLPGLRDTWGKILAPGKPRPACAASTVCIAGSCFAQSPFNPKTEPSTHGMGPIPTSRTASWQNR